MKRRAYIVGFGAIVTPGSSGCLNRSDQDDESTPATENNSSTGNISEETEEDNESAPTSENNTSIENTSGETKEDNESTPTTENNSSIGNMSEENGGSECSFQVTIIQEVPNEMTVEDANEQLMEFEVIRYAFEHATDPEENHDTVTRPSGDYETFSVVPESDQQFRETETALSDLEVNRDDDYPSGVYLEYDETVIALVAQCTT